MEESPRRNLTLTFEEAVENKCYVEWIVSSNFSVHEREKQVLTSPLFWFEKDAWCLELQLDAWNPKIVQMVQLCVGNCKRTRLDRILVRLGIVGRYKQLAIVSGMLDDIGIFKAHRWMSTPDLLYISEDCNGRVKIFCELETCPWRKAN